MVSISVRTIDQGFHWLRSRNRTRISIAINPTANRNANPRFKTRPSWSHASVVPYSPTQIASRTTIPGVAGGTVGNLRLRKATTGKVVPVKAKTPKKKNSQRGPTVGIVFWIRRYSPPQPKIPKIIAVGKNELTEGVDRDSIGEQTNYNRWGRCFTPSPPVGLIL